jgi:hypothetical protein
VSQFVELQGFDGALFRQIDAYRQDMLDSAEDLSRRVALTDELGRVLTGDLIARGKEIIRSIDVRNQNPLFPPIFLTFLENRAWVNRVDTTLVRMRKALNSTRALRTRYIEILNGLALAPMGSLFELNVDDVLDRAFYPAVPQPQLSGSSRRSDVCIDVGGQAVYVEATALDERAHWRGVDGLMRQNA